MPADTLRHVFGEAAREQIVSVDVSDTTMLRLLGVTPLESPGSAGCAVGDRLYVGGEGKVTVFDVADPARPRKLSEIKCNGTVDIMRALPRGRVTASCEREVGGRPAAQVSLSVFEPIPDGLTLSFEDTSLGGRAMELLVDPEGLAYLVFPEGIARVDADRLTRVFNDRQFGMHTVDGSPHTGDSEGDIVALAGEDEVVLFRHTRAVKSK